MNFLVAMLGATLALLLTVLLVGILRGIRRLLGTLASSLKSWATGRITTGMSRTRLPLHERRRRLHERLHSLLGHPPLN